MIGAPVNLGFLIILLTISWLIFPMLSLVVINIILENAKMKTISRFIISGLFMSVFLMFQQHVLRKLSHDLLLILLAETIVAILLFVYLIVKAVKIYREKKNEKKTADVL